MSNPTLARQAARAASDVGGVKRVAFRAWPTTLMAASFAVAWVPLVGGFLSLGLDRLKNSSDRNYELGVRAKYYKNEIGNTLGMSADRVGRGDLLKAANINPALKRVVAEVHTKESDENRTSLLVNGGVGVASLVGAGGVAKVVGEGVTAVKFGRSGLQAAKQITGGLAGGALAGALSKSEASAQELIEATEKDMARARAEGLDARAAINPQVTFMIRLSQDEALSKEVNKMTNQRFGKKFHQLDSQQMGLVMNQYPDLANATLREAHAIANGDMSIRTLAGTAPNMGAGFAGPMARSDNAQGSFVDRLNAQRASAPQQQGVSA